ncbi:MAG TPA: DegQ family serine endoprotease, partial [Candidatus Deferrimicrobium sp.]|nr:DegQ family serine endoprotease [Candidatus Deferrimicrobium sp.]
RFRMTPFMGACAIAVLAGMGGVSIIEYYQGGRQPAHAASSPVAPAQSLPDFISLAKKLGPSVVNVSTSRIRGAAQEAPSPFGGNDPGEEFWQRFFGGRTPRGPQRQSGVGSGFIVDGNGTILTNYHVVDGAQKLSVTLSDGKNYDAKVVGKDQKSDIAVIKIEAGRDLPAAALGDSDRLEVGEWVMAIGNPFGLDHTVTSGIVSAKGRNIGQGPYDNFIQTDASINPGNSGGPLLNLRGEVVGINTAIFSQSGGNIGIGFAIPSNSVKELLPQLRDKGKVVRGFIGVSVQKVSPEIAESLGINPARGALVADLVKGGPAERAGMKTGDVIIEFDRRPIKDSADLPQQVARVVPGAAVQIKVIRDGRETALSLTIGEMKEAEVTAAEQEGELGLTVQQLTPQLAETLGLERGAGLVISAVKPGSAAEEAGLRTGDVLVEINRRPVKNLADYNREIAGNDKAKSVLFLVRRGQSSLFLALKR